MQTFSTKQFSWDNTRRTFSAEASELRIKPGAPIPAVIELQSHTTMRVESFELEMISESGTLQFMSQNPELAPVRVEIFND